MRTSLRNSCVILASTIGLLSLPMQTSIGQVPALKIRPAEVSVELKEVLEEEATVKGDESEGTEAKETESQIATASHRQSQVLYPEYNGTKLQLQSFCVAPSGKVLAVCGGPVDGSQSSDASAVGYLVSFSADGTQTVLTELPFAATAITTAPDHSLYVAGDGQVAKLNANGEILKQADSPNMGDKEEMLAAAKKTAEARTKQYTQMYRQQVDMLKDRVADLEKKDEADRTRADQSRLKAYRTQMESMEATIKQLTFSPEQVLATGKRITAIAANDQDVFVSCGSISGAGYSIWRTNRDLEEPVEVISAVSGCCGQMDVQCCEDGFMLAENTSFKVGIYDRDGKSVNSFGKGDRTSAAGFGSCCNPMNVSSTSNGMILTAESSVGHIKQFDSEGNFVAYIGKAKIGGGCKHCSLGYDPSSDQYYMMHEDANSICVLANSKNLPDMTEDEKVLASIRNQFEDSLLGTWELAVKTEDAPATNTFTPFAEMAFAADGTMATSGGAYASIDGDWAWQIIGKSKAGNPVLGILRDQVEMLRLEFDFGDQNQAKVQFGNSYGATSAPWLPAKRILDCEGKACADGQCPDDSTQPTQDSTISTSADQ